LLKNILNQQIPEVKADREIINSKPRVFLHHLISKIPLAVNPCYATTCYPSCGCQGQLQKEKEKK
jgi:hypothetical protein